VYNADSESITIDPATVSMASLIVDRPRGRLMKKTRDDLVAGRDPKKRFRRADLLTAGTMEEGDATPGAKQQSTAPEGAEGDDGTGTALGDGEQGEEDLPEAANDGAVQMRLENGRVVVDADSLTLQRNTV
jgi:hypothetical protein